MARSYDNETKTLHIKCEKCGDEIDVDVKTEVEVETYITIKED